MYTGAGNGNVSGGGGAAGVDNAASPGFGTIGAGQWDQSVPGMSELPGTPRKYYVRISLFIYHPL